MSSVHHRTTRRGDGVSEPRIRCRGIGVTPPTIDIWQVHHSCIRPVQDEADSDDADSVRIVYDWWARRIVRGVDNARWGST